MKSDLKIEYVPIDEIKPYAQNAKLHPQEQVEQIKKSIVDYGMNDPIAVWHGEIVEGHGRLMACKELKFKEVPIIRLDGLTDAQRKEYMLVHNKTTMNSDFDFDILNSELLDLPEFDAEFYDFEVKIEEEESKIIEDEFPEEVETKCKPSDLWLVGKHRLICGDSTDITVLERLMDDAKADLYITDPPYNVDYQGGTKDKLKIMNDNMDDSSFRTFLRDAFTCADMVMRSGAVFYIWHADSEGYNFRGACFDIGWKVRECLIWNKSSLVLGRQDYQWKHEPCLYGWKDGASHLWASDRKQTTVLDFDKPSRNGEHPTMKPVQLFAYQISNNTHEGDAVLDSFGGSGTTLIACEQLNRKCYIAELDERYVSVIVQRWLNLTGRKDEIFCIRDGKKLTYDEVLNVI